MHACPNCESACGCDGNDVWTEDEDVRYFCLHDCEGDDDDEEFWGDDAEDADAD